MILIDTSAWVEFLRAVLDLCSEAPFEEAYWESAANDERTLRHKGLVIPRDDLFIATVAIEQRLTLFHVDRHFNVAAGGGLKLRLDTV
jgi:predicted nucleic acid-binding protein